MRRYLIALCAALTSLAALPAPAGIHYTAETVGDAGGRGSKMVVEGWVDGGGARIVFGETSTPMLDKGSYMVTQDGGQTVYLVDPKEETYTEWDVEAMLRGVGQVMQSLGGMVDVQVDNVAVVKLDSGDGPEMHGLATRYRKYRLSYDMRIKVMGMNRANHVETVNEVWSTDQLADAALGLWLREAPTTGFDAVDELIEAEMSQVQGFPLKTVSTTTTTGEKGKRQDTSTSTTVVTSLDRTVAVTPATFMVPPGYQRVEAPALGGEQQDNPLKGLFGGGR